MNPIMRVFGMVLRLVGISSPEDSGSKAKPTGGPPSWRDSQKPKPGDPTH